MPIAEDNTSAANVGNACEFQQALANSHLHREGHERREKLHQHSTASRPSTNKLAKGFDLAVVTGKLFLNWQAVPDNYFDNNDLLYPCQPE